MRTLGHIFLLIFVWQIIYLVIGNRLLWPSFDETLFALYNLLMYDPDGRFYKATLGSLTTLIIAVSCVAVLSVAVTLLALISERFKQTITTWGGIFGPVPGFTWLPIFFILFGMGIQTVYFLCVFTCCWFVFLQIFGQIDTARKTWEPQVKNLDLNYWKALTLVYLPSLLPTFISTVKISWNHTWRIVFAIEIAFGNLGGQSGLGILMSDYRGNFDTNEVYAMLLIVMSVGITINKLLDLASSRVEWR